MKDAERAVQPVAKITLVKRAVQLVMGLQTQLAQGKEPVGAAPQVFVSAGRQAHDGHGLAGRLRLRRRVQGDDTADSGVSGQRGGVVQQQQLNKAAGHQAFTARTAAPQHIQVRLLQGMVPCL